MVAQARRTRGGEPGARASAPWPTSATAWYTVLVLALSAMFANLDQSIVSLLVEPIKRDLHLSDTRMAILLGPAFALFFALIAIPVARFIDRHGRTSILALGLATWSVATACCGLAQGFWSLLLARIGVGGGEAVNQPATFSLIADSFPKERLPRAIAVMQLGVTAGGAIPFLLGAFLMSLFAHVRPIAIPGVGAIRSWQLVFVAVGLPGLAVALLLVTTVREPARRGLEVAGAPRVALRSVIAYLIAHWRVFAPMFLALAFGMIAAFAQQQWLPAFFQRTYGWDIPRTGNTIGIVQLVAMPVGLALGVWLAERFDRKGRAAAPLLVVILAGFIRVPASIAMPLMPTAALAVLCQTLVACSTGISGASQNAALQIVTPNQMRGQVTALYLFTYNVIGFGLGPLIAGILTDEVFRAESALRYSLLTMAAVLAPLALAMVWLGVQPYVREVRRLATFAPQPTPGA
ncbi:MAG TPA: MFS transporter [Steroidobacteraceae bacterium]|nr:MFS transporter [Steroidobacteraceae bacterium]